MNTKEKLDIINSGGEVDETDEYGSWKGIKIRKGNVLGKVIKDTNGMFRRLCVKFKNGSEEEIVLNNTGSDPASCHKYEWYCRQNKVWYRF